MRTELPVKSPWLRRVLVGVCALAVAVLVGAAIPAMAGSKAVTYYACVTNRTGAVKIVAKTARCRLGQHKISWNKTGPQGPPGVVTGYHSITHGGSTSTSSITVEALLLPAGSFIVNASVDLAVVSNEGESTNVADCRLLDGSGTAIDTAAATVVLDGLTGAATLTMTGATTTGGKIQVSCTSGSADNVVAASITAIPVHSLS